jgi:hypothetical protein
MLPGVVFDPADAPEEPPPAYPRVMLVDDTTTAASMPACSPAVGVERRGVWGGTKGTLFPHPATITREEEEASDHAAIWVDLRI